MGQGVIGFAGPAAEDRELCPTPAIETRRRRVLPKEGESEHLSVEALGTVEVSHRNGGDSHRGVDWHLFPSAPDRAGVVSWHAKHPSRDIFGMSTIGCDIMWFMAPGDIDRWIPAWMALARAYPRF